MAPVVVRVRHGLPQSALQRSQSAPASYRVREDSKSRRLRLWIVFSSQFADAAIPRGNKQPGGKWYVPVDIERAYGFINAEKNFLADIFNDQLIADQR